MLIKSGQSTEKQAIDLSNNLVSLLTSLVEQNIDETKKNLELLKESSIPEVTLLKLESDITTYLNGLQVINADNKNQNKTDSILELEENSKNKSLTL